MPEATFTPALMGEGAAAFYLGVSASTLRTLKIPRKALGKRRLYDRRDLDAFSEGLPYEDENKAVVSCDTAFG